MEPPIGSVIAFAGDLPSGFEASTGWMLCDGRLLDGNDPQFQPLFNVIRFAWGGDPDHNRFNIPDLLGRFLRGVEPEQLGSRDPDGDQRTPTQSGGHGGRAARSKTTRQPCRVKFSELSQMVPTHMAWILR